jgi:hypoxanthine phosphoribosyltransferase
VEVPIHYVGFEIPNHFVIGYGLDYAQKVRNLRGIYRLADAHS